MTTTIYGSDELARRLAKWRKARGLSREAAAALIGVSCRQYSRWEQGRFERGPGRLARAAIEAAMGAPLSGERESESETK